jgi:hypothetical protein
MPGIESPPALTLAWRGDTASLIAAIGERPRKNAAGAAKIAENSRNPALTDLL